MKKLNYKNLIILILMGVASICLFKDLLTLLNGSTYTWFGLVTGMINIVIVGLGIDVLRG